MIKLEKVLLANGKATCEVKTLWDADNLYLLAVIKDPVLSVVHTKPWNQDSVEFFINAKNDQNPALGEDDAQYRISAENVISGRGGAFDEANIKSVAAKTADGYI